MNKISKVSSYFLIAMLLLGVFFVAIPASVKAVTAQLALEPSSFEFTTDDKSVGDTFVINVTIANVEEMSGWQVSISWDASLLGYVSFVLPADNVFAYDSPVSASSDSPGNVVGGANLGPSATHYFNGSGILAQLTLEIIQGVGIVPPTSVECDLVFSNVGPTGDTYLLSGLSDIPCTTVNSHYHYYWVAPTLYPKLYLRPSVIKPAKVGDVFGVDVMVENVKAGWEITAFQFSIMWNTTLITAAAPYWTDGTFLEKWNYGDGVIYAMDLNTHDRVIPLSPIPDDYNYSIAGELLLPDMLPPWNGTYHSPYPQSVGAELLGTFYFEGIFSTVSPEELWTTIDFITEDVLVLNHYNTEIPIVSLTGADYRCPMTVTGLSIDVYTQYVYPYGGQGGNQTSDSFGPQQEVCLTADVTYNDYPVQQKLVGFEIWHEGATQSYHFARENTTDIDGKAHMCFRLPWPCANPVGEIFGWWYVNATVEVAGQVVVDNLKFWVWWPVEVVSIEPKFSSVVQSKQGTEMCFEMVYRRYDAQELPVLLTATVYDELGFFIGSAYLSTTVSNDPVLYDGAGNPIPKDYVWDFCIPIPSNAVVGKCTIYGNAFTDWPWLGGYPYCPEVTNLIDFFIAAPP